MFENFCSLSGEEGDAGDVRVAGIVFLLGAEVQPAMSEAAQLLERSEYRFRDR